MKERIVRDPIHRFISLSHYDFVQKLVDTPHVQRLRRLSQLGVSVFVYPSATHNRFNHSLGAMELFVRMYDHLARDVGFSKETNEELIRLGVASILLHDIGHGPFSHASEHIFGFDHEDMTNEIILNTEIKDILSSSSIDPESVTKIIGKIGPPEHNLLTQLISSQLDADRLDYLARDTYFTGAEYGTIDLERIIRTMQIYRGKGEIDGYAVNIASGISSLESYILARHLMYQGVYFHKTTRGFELLIEKIFARVKALIQDKKIDLPEELKSLEGKQILREDLQNLDDHVLYHLIMTWSKNSDSHLASLARRFINRDPLKAIEILPGEFKKYTDNNEAIKHLLTNKGYPPEYYLMNDQPSETPYSPYSIKGPDDETTVITNIFVMNKEGIPKEISTLSRVVRALSEEQYNFRIYVPQDCKAETLSIMGQKVKSS